MSDTPATPEPRTAGRPKGPQAPKAKATTPKPDPRPVGRPSNKSRRSESLAGMYIVGGTGVSMVSPSIGAAIIAQSTEAATALAELAERNARFARWLDAGMDVGGALAVLVAHLPIIMAIGIRVTRGEPEQTDPAAGPLGVMLGALFGGMADDDQTTP